MLKRFVSVLLYFAMKQKMLWLSRVGFKACLHAFLIPKSLLVSRLSSPLVCKKVQCLH